MEKIRWGALEFLDIAPIMVFIILSIGIIFSPKKLERTLADTKQIQLMQLGRVVCVAIFLARVFYCTYITHWKHLF